MDKKFNDFNRHGRRFDRFDEFKRDKFRGIMSDARNKYHNGSNGFRDGFRSNISGFRDDLRDSGSVREKEVVRDRDRDDGNNFSEKFHERQVDYHKDVRSKQSDDDLHDGRDDMRRDLDDIRGRGKGFQDEFRREDP